MDHAKKEQREPGTHVLLQTAPEALLRIEASLAHLLTERNRSLRLWRLLRRDDPTGVRVAVNNRPFLSVPHPVLVTKEP